ncbi:MAG: S46 family peptidase, partial [Myxococcaceae bacterium]
MKRLPLVVVAAVLAASAARADEGMWTFNNFPSAKVKEKYGFEPTREWLDHVRLSSVRLAGGCSASLVSPSGLVMTNHHCAHSCIEQLSTARRDYVTTGFWAKAEGNEVKCPEIEVNQLVEIKDVTERVTGATRGLSDQAFNEAQKAELSRIEKECATGDAVRCEVVSLYHGGLYQLYRYRRFQDVRLVFAPEFAIAFFGGDPDN